MSEKLKNLFVTLKDRVAQRTIELEAANQELQRLSHLDGLTQVANRRGFDDYLAQEWLRALREQRPLGLILCDVDFFKQYNDCYGHLAGDNCLRRVAQQIQLAVARPSDLVARYGGEEFAALPLKHKTNGCHRANDSAQGRAKVRLLGENNKV